MTTDPATLIKGHLILRSEDDLMLLAQSEVVTDLFGTREEFIHLYNAQINCVEFGSLTIPRERCFDTYNLILQFVQESREQNTSLFSIDDSDAKAVPLTGLLRHVLQNNEQAGTGLLSLKAQRFWRLLAAYHKIDRLIISRYANRSNSESKRRTQKIGELTDEDQVDVRFLVALIEQELGSVKPASKSSSAVENKTERIPEFYILFFFDIYSAFRYYVRRIPKPDKERIRHHQVIMRMSHFVLALLPRVIGTYSFGDYNSDLKDLAFRNLEPEYYLSTKASIEKQLSSSEWRSQVKTGLREIANSFQVKVAILERKKGVYSAYQKSLRYGTQVEDLWDLLAFRVIIDSNNAQYCYQFLSQIQERFKRWSDPKGYSDYIGNRKKANEYESLHLVLESTTGSLVEIQIRTSAMNNIAEFGSASHEVYKRGSVVSEGPEATPSARRGRQVLDQLLSKHDLTINDYVSHLGPSLEHIPIEHYYEGIDSGKYDPNAIVRKILQDRRERHEVGPDR